LSGLAHVIALVLSPAVLAACPAPRAPSVASIAAQTIEVGRAGAVLSGVAGDGQAVFAALASARPVAQTTIEAIHAGVLPPAWHTELAGAGGPLVLSGGKVVAVLGGTGSVAGITLRGEPGAVVAALDATTGEIAWKLAIDATEWSVIAALATTADGVLVGGSFAGTLRIGAKIVSSAGKADGFVARLTATGGVAWLVRVGGPGADAVQGVAAAGDRIAIAGTFTAGADLLGQPLPPYDERSLNADGFVAELDAAGARRWAQTFGGKADESVTGVAIDARGRVAVAANVRNTVHVAGVDLVASGLADGMVAWWSPGGGAGATALLGGADFDGLRAITAAGDHVLVAGFYSGVLRLGALTLTAGGGDDAFVAELDASGTVVEAWPVSGDGREEVTALTAIPGGFLAGVAHTAAATVGTGALAAPRDPLSGAAIVVRPVR
jgi:outer membrane protein assembly factor BamB